MEREIKVKFIPAANWWKNAKWELLEAYTSYNDEITVHAGFITDGASIPIFARIWFSATGRYFGAAIVHDYILQSDGNWLRANDQFEEELLALQIAPWRKNLIMIAVTIKAWYS